jgi:hypothetical protein
MGRDVLRDNDIRNIFSIHHSKRYPNSKLLNEVRINNGLAIADLVSIGIKTSHCYEIKGDTDKISRTVNQAKSYDTVFNRISLITTNAHFKKAVNTIPPYWGIILVSNTPSIKLNYFRKASFSPFFSKQKALFTLWRDELLNILLMKNIIEKSTNKYSRRELINILCDNVSTTEICRLMNNYLLIREQNYHKKYWFRANP